MKTPRVQFLLADGTRARWVSRNPVGDYTTRSEIAAEEPELHPAGPGEAYESISPERHGLREPDELTRKRRLGFAIEVAGAVNAAARHGACEKIALVAPARMLGPITERLSPEARRKLCGTLDRDLVKTPDHELGPWLRPMEFPRVEGAGGAG